MDRAELEALIEEGLTQREIAGRLQVSQTTVRYWLRRWALRTHPTASAAEARHAREAGILELERDCNVHGSTPFRLYADGVYRCRSCRARAVAARRRRVKEILVREAGGACQLCGYDKHLAALQFHHLNPATKRFGLAAMGLTRSIDAMRREAAKCILLCSNCHAEVEVGFTPLPPDVAANRG